MGATLVMGLACNGLWVDEYLEAVRYFGSSLNVGIKPPKKPIKPECWQGNGKRKKDMRYQYKSQ